MKQFSTVTAVAALMLATGSASAQQTSTQSDEPSPSRQQDRIGAILGALFGDRSGSTSSIAAQWSAGRTPLANQRAQFESRVDADVRAGALSQNTGGRLKYDYYDLVQIEARYGADRRFTAQEQADLTERYNALTQILTNGGYVDGNGDYGNDDFRAENVAEGQAAFVSRVNAAVSARRITRAAGTRLRNDYAALVRTEANYLRDGRLTTREREDLEAQLDALDSRVGDVGYGGGSATQTPRARLDAIARALPNSGLNGAALAQIRVEHEDLSRLETAFGRYTPTADERVYLERRLADLEMRARIRR